MYMAFPCSEYYGSSDFSTIILKASCIRLGFKYLYLIGMLLSRGIIEISPANSSVLFMHARFLDPAGSESPLRYRYDSDVGFHVIKRVALSGIHIFRGSITSRHLRHSGLHDSLHTLRKDPSPDLSAILAKTWIRSSFACWTFTCKI